MMGKMNVITFLGAAAALVGTVGAQTCTGNIPGVQAQAADVCCVLECGTCGGVNCAPVNSTLTAADCCSSEIIDNGSLCSETNAAPCILTTEAAAPSSTCDNGQVGVQDPDTDVCCPLTCGTQCGGEGCGTIPGVDAGECCASQIIEADVPCDGITTPCVQTSAPMANATCTNGLEGIESEGVCCDARCGVCGGPTCGNVAGLEGTECCINQIQTAGQLCSVTNAAPCVVDVEIIPSTCSNGLPGVSDGNVCCAEACNGNCGGPGCGAIPNTAGSLDCCSMDIIALNTSCTVSMAAPCVMEEGSFTPAPSAGSREFAFSMAPTPAGQTASPTTGTGVPTAAPTSTGSGSRGGAFTGAPSSAPTFLAPGTTFAPGTTAPPELIEELSGAGTSSVGTVVTAAAMAGGLFAVFAAARN